MVTGQPLFGELLDWRVLFNVSGGPRLPLRHTYPACPATSGRPCSRLQTGRRDRCANLGVSLGKRTDATATGRPPLRLDEIGQIALTVSDQARSTSFYRDVLGMKFLFDAGSMVFFECGAIRFALRTSASPASPGGIILYFRVPGIQAAHPVLEARGVTFIQGRSW